MSSYENWFSVAKGCLKWSDQSASLFWEMLNTAVTYLYPDQLKASREETFIDIECVVIFLAMHISDTLASKPAAPTVAYEAVWPLNENGEVFPSSPVASPSSPVRELRSQRVQSPLSSPMSPRSPRGSPQKPSSPRTHSPTSSRTPRASTQHLHSVRQKIAIILKALNSSDVDSLGPVESEEATQQLDFFVTRRLVNALGLVLCGGQSRDQAVTPLSALHPLWESSDSNAKLEARDLVSWINLHLSMNDLLYPALQAPALLDNGMEEPSKDTKSQQPQRVTMSLASLSRFSPTVLSGASATTVVHAVTCGYSRASSFRSRHGTSQRSLSGSDQVLQDLLEADSDLSALDIGVSGDAFLTNDSEHLALTPTQSPQKSVEGSSAAFSYEEFGDSKYDLSHDYKFRDLMQTEGINHPKLEQTLPQLFLSYYNRSKIYMISPYYGATITGCMDSDILIGAVYGAVIVNGCERVRLTVACRRLVVINCLECEFQVATLSPTVIIGDCRNLTIGPHNACYRNLKHHIRLADLPALLTQTSSTGGASVETARNVWSSLCDVNSCIELVGATSEKNNTSTGVIFDLPKPHSSTAILQPAEQFHSLVVPFKAELANLEVRLILTVFVVFVSIPRFQPQ